MILCASILSNKSLMEEATKCLFRTVVEPHRSDVLLLTTL